LPTPNDLTKNLGSSSVQQGNFDFRAYLIGIGINEMRRKINKNEHTNVIFIIVIVLLLGD